MSAFAQSSPYPQQPQQYPQAGQYPQQTAPYPQDPNYPQQPGYPPASQYPPQGYPPPGYPQQPGYPPAAQYPPQQPPYFPPAELERIVSRIALYPDPLLAQVLAAATYSDQIPDAARWADQHHYLTGDALAAAINGDRLPWDPSVQALLPFPNILDMMASDPSWTRELGDAFLASQPAVMDAVQRERRKAWDYGYLRSSPQIVVTNGPYIAIAPANPAFIVVPYYNPAVVYFPPRPGFYAAGAIGYNFGISLGVAFRPWGWGYNRFDWGSRVVVVNNVQWNRTWVNRVTYVHPYAPGVRYVAPAVRPGAPVVARPAETHQLEPRNEQERRAWQNGHARQEEHHEERHEERR